MGSIQDIVQRHKLMNDLKQEISKGRTKPPDGTVEVEYDSPLGKLSFSRTEGRADPDEIPKGKVILPTDEEITLTGREARTLWKVATKNHMDRNATHRDVRSPREKLNQFSDRQKIGTALSIVGASAALIGGGSLWLQRAIVNPYMTNDYGEAIRRMFTTPEGICGMAGLLCLYIGERLLFGNKSQSDRNSIKSDRRQL